MPLRTLRDGILKSRRVNALSPMAEVFYRRLMSIADDYGRHEAAPDILNNLLYPCNNRPVTDAEVEEWLAECDHQGLVQVYVVDGVPYLQIWNFKQKIRLRNGSKYPDPPNQPIKPEPPTPPANGRGIQNADDAQAVDQAWQIEQARAVCRQHGFTANEIDAVLNKVLESGEKVTAWTRYLKAACENHRRKNTATANGAGGSGAGPPGGESVTARAVRKLKAEEEARQKGGPAP